MFTINKSGIKYCKDKKKENQRKYFHDGNIKDIFVLICTPILLHRARKDGIYRRRCL